MRLPWKYHVLPRHVLPDTGDSEGLERHMTCLVASLAALQGEARESVLSKETGEEYQGVQSEEKGSGAFWSGGVFQGRHCVGSK